MRTKKEILKDCAKQEVHFIDMPLLIEVMIDIRNLLRHLNDDLVGTLKGEK